MAQPAARPQLQEQGSAFMALPQSGCLPAWQAGRGQIRGQRWRITRVASAMMEAHPKIRSSTFFHSGVLVAVFGPVAPISELWREGGRGAGGRGAGVGLQGTIREKRRISAGV